MKNDIEKLKKELYKMNKNFSRENKDYFKRFHEKQKELMELLYSYHNGSVNDIIKEMDKLQFQCAELTLNEVLEIEK